MSPGRALLAGLLHGPAELLPVSSSAHAALLLQDTPPEQRKELEVALHAGTLVALGPPRGGRDRLWLVLTTAPAALAGLALERPIEQRLGTPRTLAAGLLAGAALLALADRGEGQRDGEPTAADALVLGVAQAAALVPGISRHGAALSALRARGFTREAAHRISREAAKPVLAGAAVLKGIRLVQRRPPRDELLALAAGAGASAVSTRLAARAMEGRGVRAPLWPYAAYRALLAAAIATGSGTSPGASSRRSA
jgi:undecaprenyl-diphosphatase